MYYGQSSTFEQCQPGVANVDAVASINQDAKLAIEWHQELTGRASRPFQLPICLRLRGVIVEAALEQALNWIVLRHSALRTRFQRCPPVSGVPMTMLSRRFTAADGWSVPIAQPHTERHATVHLTVRSSSASAAPWSALLQNELRQAVDWSRTPVLRATLLKGPPQHGVLICIVSHFAADGWSQALFVRELQRAYRSFVLHGDAPSVPPLARDFSAFARWQRDKLAQPSALARLAFRQQDHIHWLPHVVTVSDLGVRSEYRGTRDARLGLLRLRLSGQLSTEVRVHCRSRRVTVYILVLAGLFLLSYRNAPRSRAAVWVRFANRLMPETEHVIGWFSEERLLGVDMTPKMRLADVVDAVRAVVLAGADDQFLPAAAVQHPLWTMPGRVSPADELRVSLDELQGPRTGIEMGSELAADRLLLPNASFRSPFRLYLESGAVIAINCVYPRSALSRAAALGVLHQLRRAISDLVRASGERLSA